SLAQGGPPESSTSPADVLHRDHRVFRIGQYVGDVNRPAFEHRSADERAAAQLDRMMLHMLVESRRIIIRSNVLITRTLLTGDCRHVRLAKLGGRFDQGIEYDLEIECRAANDLEHVGGGSLLLQRLAKLIEQTRVLDGDNSLGRRR